MEAGGYALESSETCYIYYPAGTMEFTEESSVDYIVMPWISCCSAENVKIL